jgi:hypothetical protein
METARFGDRRDFRLLVFDLRSKIKNRQSIIDDGAKITALDLQLLVRPGFLATLIGGRQQPVFAIGCAGVNP